MDGGVCLIRWETSKGAAASPQRNEADGEEEGETGAKQGFPGYT